MQGAIPPSSSELFRSSDRLSFVYVEHATISRADSAVTFVKEGGRGALPCCEFERFAVGTGARVLLIRQWLCWGSAVLRWCGLASRVFVIMRAVSLWRVLRVC